MLSAVASLNPNHDSAAQHSILLNCVINGFPGNIPITPHARWKTRDAHDGYSSEFRAAEVRFFDVKTADSGAKCLTDQPPPSFMCYIAN
ncbi:hypothetical protein NDU88_006001 [Pleurodeles waltl]|uniref:Ig-like domain-containing protein n=1 Tax=Pleurodeles waltl TaxID=8319 RepID=A0AAV7WZX4_PLEWA|nr:hypothetical protein NDU88_006001 [Pleurodeles waltl]